MDDNVHMQNTMQLVDKLTDLDIDFTLMLYPHTRHGFSYSKWGFMMRNSAGFWFRNLLDRELDVDKD
jgi:dipeptidyl-peptidase-4